MRILVPAFNLFSKRLDPVIPLTGSSVLVRTLAPTGLTFLIILLNILFHLHLRRLEMIVEPVVLAQAQSRQFHQV
jgi:hypothetical protein